MSTNINTLLDYLDSFHPMSPELRAHLAAKLKVKKLRKDEFLLQEGDICRNVYFVVEGLVRAFTPKSGEQPEITNWFMMKGEVIFSVLSFYEQKSSHESLQCLKDSEFLYISFDELQFINRHFEEFNYIRANLTQQYYAQCEERCAVMRMRPAKTRYLYLNKYYARLVEQIEQIEFLASFLAMSYRNFIRMRSAKKTAAGIASFHHIIRESKKS